MLKKSSVTIETFCQGEIDMLLFVLKSIRGGVSQLNTRYVEANYPYFPENYDSSKETNFLMDLGITIEIVHNDKFLDQQTVWDGYQITSHTGRSLSWLIMSGQSV